MDWEKKTAHENTTFEIQFILEVKAKFEFIKGVGITIKCKETSS